MIKAIETKYKGYRFRSRLEARWAVFYDALGLKWEYEPEGFDLGDGIYYLPDFRVERLISSGHIGGTEWNWIEIKSDMSNDEIERNWWVTDEAYKISKFSEEISAIYTCFGIPTLPPIKWDINGWVSDFNTQIIRMDKHTNLCAEYEDPVGNTKVRYFPNDGKGYCWQAYGDEFFLGSIELSLRKHIESRELQQAYEAARSARFEFGENGAPKE